MQTTLTMIQKLNNYAVVVMISFDFILFKFSLPMTMTSAYTCIKTACIVTFITKFQHIGKLNYESINKKGKILYFYFGYFWVTIYVSFLWHRLEEVKKKNKKEKKAAKVVQCMVFYVLCFLVSSLCFFFSPLLYAQFMSMRCWIEYSEPFLKQ